MIREPDIGYSKIEDVNFARHEHEVELELRIARRKRRESADVRTAQTRCTHEEIKLISPGKGVEVTGDDDGFLRLQNQIVQMA